MALEIGFCGVSGAAPGSGEETASCLVNGHLLVDAGWNAAASVQALGAAPTDVDEVLITHCHQDHTLGLPGLLFANRARSQARPGAPVLRL
ncbi:MAG: MBL fold metallo-hydrolase [Gemmatimonadota bacterium]